MKLNKFLILLLITNISIAQQITAHINKITTKEFYKIIVAPEIRSASKPDFGDLRIFDSKRKEVPYIVEISNQEKMEQQFESFKIISNKAVEKKQTSITIENPIKKINEITLEIANSEITKTYNISGSNDNEHWFGIVNKSILSDLKNEDATSILKTISLPLCSYSYLKIDFDDTKTLPVNVLKVGTIKNKFSRGDFQEIKSKNLITTQIPVEKKSLIKVTFDYPQDVDKIVFDISNPSLFNRSTRIYTIENQTIKHKTKNIENEIATFTLASNAKNDFNISCSKQKEFFIEIDNQDNPILAISSIKFYQKPVYLFTSLDPNEEYTIETGNSNLYKPAYDLMYFEDEMEHTRFTIGMNTIQYKENSKKANDTNKSFWQQAWFMWLCIAIGGVTILFFSNSLIKDLKNN